MLEFIFWFSVFLIGWVYVGYPFAMKLWSDRSGLVFHVKKDYEPTVTVIIATAGGASKIYEKLHDTFETVYPHDKISVIVALDGSCYKTRAEVDRFFEVHPSTSRRTTVIEVERGGKESAQDAAVKIAQGEVCVFTDLGTTMDDHALHNLTRHFFDHRVGAVDGMSRIGTDGHSNEGLYLKYENKIREWESNTTGLVGTGGCLFAARTSMLQDNMEVNGEDYKGFVPDLQSDFRTALVSQTFGMTTVLDKDAVATFADGAEDKEFGRKHRTTVRAINVMMNNLHLLNLVKYGPFSLALLSHKLLKWMVPFFMVSSLTAAFILCFGEGWFWKFTYMAMIIAYILAFNNYENKFGKIWRFFVLTNLALLKAWYSYWKGERYVYWEPTKR